MSLPSEELTERLTRLLRDPTPEVAEVKSRWEGVTHTVRNDGKWRLEGFVTWFTYFHEHLRLVDPSLPPLPPPHCFEPASIARLFGIPPEQFGLRPLFGPVGKPGRPKTTQDIADFAFDRRPAMTWKEIYAEWKRLHPHDLRATNWQRFRDAYRRYYRHGRMHH